MSIKEAAPIFDAEHHEPHAYAAEQHAGPDAVAGNLAHFDIVGAAERILGTPADVNDSQVGNNGSAGGQPGGPNSAVTPEEMHPGDVEAVVEPKPEDADVAVANKKAHEALTDLATQYFVFNAFVSPDKEGATIAENLAHPQRKFARVKSSMAATVSTDGMELDLQHSSDLSEVGDSDRPRTHEPLLLTMRGQDDELHFFAYNNQTLIRFPDQWVAMLREDLEQTGGRFATTDEYMKASYNIDFGIGRIDARNKRVNERSSEIVTDEFVQEHTWDYTGTELPSELRIGDTWGGDSGAGGLTLEAVTVGKGAMVAAGLAKDDLSAYPNMHFEETMSPLTLAADMIERVEARRKT